MSTTFERISGLLRGKTGVWLGAGAAAIALSAGSFWLGRMSVPPPQAAMSDASDMDSYADDTALAPKPTVAADNSVPAPAHYSHAHAGEPEGAAVIAAATKASGTQYVHRTNSDLRAEPSYASQVLKKEPKGAQVQLVALSDKWAEVQDGAVKGWMRASILKDTPPDTDGKRKKKSDD
jgi:hypothetical protein